MELQASVIPYAVITTAPGSIRLTRRTSSGPKPPAPTNTRSTYGNALPPCASHRRAKSRTIVGTAMRLVHLSCSSTSRTSPASNPDPLESRPPRFKNTCSAPTITMESALTNPPT